MMKKSNRYQCIPVAKWLVLLFGFCLLMYAALMWFIYSPRFSDIVIPSSTQEENIIEICGASLLGAGAIGCFIWSIISCSRYIVLENDRLLCKALFRKTIVLEYSKCNVGIDYSYNSSAVFWWIYFCIGPMPKYNPKIPVNRVNAIKYSDSFVKIMYSDEVYSALLEVLPKKQRTALTCAYNIHIRE